MLDSWSACTLKFVSFVVIQIVIPNNRKALYSCFPTSRSLTFTLSCSVNEFGSEVIILASMYPDDIMKRI